METKTKSFIAGALILASGISGCATYDGPRHRHYEGQRNENHGRVTWGAVPYRDSSVEDYRFDRRYNNPSPQMQHHEQRQMQHRYNRGPMPNMQPKFCPQQRKSLEDLSRERQKK